MDREQKGAIYLQAGRRSDFHESSIRGISNHDTAQSSTVNDGTAISDRRVPRTIPPCLYGTTYRSSPSAEGSAEGKGGRLP